MSSFKKIVVIPEQYGNRDFATATKIVEVPFQLPSKGQIAVCVAHTGIEASDIIQMVGGYGALAGKKPEASWNGRLQVGDTGCEGVGVVTHVGEGVQPGEFAVGDAVAFQGFGVSFRESVLLDVARAANRSGFTPPAFKVPAPSPEWTAVPISAMTATGGLEICGDIKPGQSVLVTGAAGGTGHIAVQWAKRMFGCRVAGTCGSAEKEAMLRRLGCDVVVNYNECQDVEAALRKEFPKGFDLVYEAVGGRIGNIARRLLAPNSGFLVQIGYVSTDYTDTSAGSASKVDGGALKLQDGQGESFFFVGDWRTPHRAGVQKTAGDWDALVAKTVDAVASGAVEIQLDPACSAFSGMEGVYAAQARMREGVNSGKLYVAMAAPQKGAAKL